METPDYLEYKRSKEQYEAKPVKKTRKVFRFFWLFIFLFVGFFILIYNYGSNYFSKVDVEYEKNLNLENFAGNNMYEDDYINSSRSST